MKKVILIASLIILVLVTLTACNNNNDSNGTAEQNQPTQNQPAQDPPPQDPPPQDPPAATSGYRTGLGIYTSLGSSFNPGEGRGANPNGRVQADSTVVAITVNSEGIITHAEVDAAQTFVEFDPYGVIVSDLNAPIFTKGELRDDYNMRRVSDIGREWYEQAAAFAEWMIGQTPAQVLGLSLSAGGVPEDAALTSSVTVNVSTYIEALRNAYANLRPIDASGPFTMGIGIESKIDASFNVGEGRGPNGRGQIDSYVAVVTLDANGVIVAITLDSIQARLEWADDALLIGDINAPNRTKLEQGDDYNMRRASDIEREWDEQANALADWTIGRTLSQVLGMNVHDVDGRVNVPNEPELLASVTLPTGPFFSVIEKAVNNAR